MNARNPYHPDGLWPTAGSCTRTYTSMVEVTHQFLADYALPEPRAIYTFTKNNAISILIDGDGAAANLISESLYWENNLAGITSATVHYDGTEITVQVYPS